ncbi:MAG: hypothetical protein P0Y55_15655 [Candidatus Cohnella colombiensis]|uniref:Uncharacterized protein n=1 Tax=Candidatus Cohnella colombiensis TaxID=3121368 RepID=A0AA95JFN8_9BACL|nr:MAG: hypothetical protein P0Y55_15655 [Cohnella sp.]
MTAGRLGKEQRACARVLFFVFYWGYCGVNELLNTDEFRYNNDGNSCRFVASLNISNAIIYTIQQEVINDEDCNWS